MASRAFITSMFARGILFATTAPWSALACSLLRRALRIEDLAAEQGFVFLPQPNREGALGNRKLLPNFSVRLPGLSQGLNLFLDFQIVAFSCHRRIVQYDVY